MSSEDEQDACNVCEGDNSPNKNPIIFCDGKGCNMPVHKRCYGLKQVPGGDWFCQRCENKKRKKATNIVCCSVQAGAVKKTKIQDKYMHIVCALWNKDIDNTLEPYPVPEDQLNKHACSFCLKKVGLCIHCEEPGCSEHWHVTCAINNNIITPAASVPVSFSPRCVKHEIKPNKNKASTSTSSSSSSQKKKSRRLVKAKKISDSEDSDEDEEDDDFEGEDDEEEEDDDDEEEEEEEEEEEDEDMEKDQGKKKEDKNTIKLDADNKKEEDESSSSSGSSSAFNSQFHAKKVLAIGNKPPSSSSVVSSGLSSPSTIRSPSLKKEIPMKRRLSPNSLFGQDQSSDDSDDDMGTKSRPKSTNSNASSNTNNNKSLSSMSSKHVERIEAKRKKSGLESASSASLPSLLEDIKRPATSLTPPLPTGTPTKQKLPNKAHLLNNISTSITTTTNISNPSSSANPSLSSSTSNGTGIRPVLTPPIKKQNGPGIIKDIDEIQNDIRAGAQRWNNSSSTPLHHPQPTTPHSISTTFFENDGKSRMDNNRKSMNGGDKEELLRMREENRKLIEFKRTVTEVFTNLNVPLQSGLLPSTDVDNYVAQLQLLLKRVGPIRENERVQIQECVKGALQHNNHQQQ